MAYKTLPELVRALNADRMKERIQKARTAVANGYQLPPLSKIKTPSPKVIGKRKSKSLGGSPSGPWKVNAERRFDQKEIDNKDGGGRPAFDGGDISPCSPTTMQDRLVAFALDLDEARRSNKQLNRNLKEARNLAVDENVKNEKLRSTLSKVMVSREKSKKKLAEITELFTSGYAEQADKEDLMDMICDILA